MNFNNYLSALSTFYSEASYWAYENQINQPSDSRIISLKKKAKNLLNELKKLPPDMQNQEVIRQATKILNL